MHSLRTPEKFFKYSSSNRWSNHNNLLNNFTCIFIFHFDLLRLQPPKKFKPRIVKNFQLCFSSVKSVFDTFLHVEHESEHESQSYNKLETSGHVPPKDFFCSFDDSVASEGNGEDEVFLGTVDEGGVEGATLTAVSLFYQFGDALADEDAA